jgi:putative spermidine/putrescine transport system permease protein
MLWRRRLSRGFGYFFLTGVLLFGFLPAIVVAITSFTDTNYVVFPPQGFTTRWYSAILERGDMIAAFQLSVMLAAVTATIATVLGGLAAFAFVRYRFPGREGLETFAMGPLTVPRIVLGLALLQAFTAMGFGSSFRTLLAGHVVVTTPFAVRLVLAGLAGMDRNMERAAQSLGASYPVTLRTVTLPMVKTALFGAFAFTAILSFDDVAMTIFLSGVQTTTLPVKLYTLVEFNTTPLITSISTVLVVMGIVALVIIERTIGTERAFGARAD